MKKTRAKKRVEALPTKLCLARIAHGVWCLKEDGHAGDCASHVEPVYGPLEDRPALWRRHKGFTR